MNIREYQQWLADHGGQLGVDGIPGPRTRAEPLRVFANLKAPAVTADEKSAIARSLGGTVEQIDAVASVESSGGGFQNDGLPKALYERHYAWRGLRVKIPFLSDPQPGGYTTDADRDGVNDNWEKIVDLALRNPIAAYESASFGKFQIMGAWAPKMGYESALDFVWALSRSERAHYEALARFIAVNNLTGAFRKISASPASCEAFALGYNGKQGVARGYHQKIARAMR